jgi:hypothetical protein
MTELILNSGEFIDATDSVHDVILNRLDLRHSNNGKTYTYDADEFRKALPLFKETPLVYASVHPQHIGQMSLEDALKEVDGRLVGTPQDVLVNDPGTLFRGSLHITDPEVRELVKLGKALLSTAFSAAPDSDGVLRNIVPNHILVYPMSTGIDPGDRAALFLNQDSTKNGESTMTEEKKESPQLDLMRELVQNQAAKDELTTKLTEQAELVFNQKSQLEEKDRLLAEKDQLITEKSELITNQTTTIDGLNAKVTELAGVIEEIKSKAKNSKRDRIFNQFLPGTKTAFEERKSELYDDEKYDDLIAEMFAHQSTVKTPPTEESGVVDVTNQEPEAAKTEEAKSAWELADVRL